MKTLASARDLKEIRQRFAALTEGDQRMWGTMSMGEMVCHVRDSFAMALAEHRAMPVRGALPPRVLKWVALAVPMPWPRNLVTAPELEPAAAVDDSPATFVTVKNEAAQKLERLATASQTATDHPFFGLMCTRDWLRWGYLHTDHHLRQFGR